VAAWRDGFLSLFQIGCLVLFLSIVIGRTISLRARSRVNPIALRVRKRGLLGMVELVLFVQVNLWAITIVMYAVPGLLPAASWVFGGLPVAAEWIQAAGVVAIAVGFVFYAWALRSLGSSWRLGIDESQPGQLVTTGIYALSRNPIYTFFDLYSIGTFLVNGTWLFFAFAVLTVFNLHYQILHEERHLGAVYGHSYQAYCARTARYWTWQRALRLDRERAAG
jgi:protein-S-isoprenylcysteine O-methyltransferase Ste14